MHDLLECSLDCHSYAETDLYGSYDPLDRGELNDILNIDDDDKRIIMYLQEDADITHSEIGRRVNKSQPAIGSRIKKLLENNVIGILKGVNFKDSQELNLMQVLVTSVDPDSIASRLEDCPVLSLGFRTEGAHSLALFFSSPSLERIDTIIDECIRSEPSVLSLDMSLVLDAERDLVLPFDFLTEDWDKQCENCTIGCKIHALDEKEALMVNN